MYKFRLYIIGMKNKIDADVLNLKKLLSEKYNDHYSLEVIDILDSCTNAVNDYIFVTPTLVRYFPVPKIKIIGDINNHEKITQLLNI